MWLVLGLLISFGLPSLLSTTVGAPLAEGLAVGLGIGTGVFGYYAETSGFHSALRNGLIVALAAGVVAYIGLA